MTLASIQRGVHCHLVSLPTEIQNGILRFVEEDSSGNHTLRMLSRTCTFFFDLFKQELYQTVVLRADQRSGRSLQRIAAGPRASLVKRLVFRARDPRPAWERKHDTRHQLSIPSKQVFLFLHRFPGLVEVEFDVEWKLDLWFSDHPEPRLYPVTGYSETYRSILDEALRALGRSVHRNNARTVPRLIIRQLPPRRYRSLVDHSLHALLSDLRGFRIDFPDHSSHPVVPAHSTFVSNLDIYFLNHLCNLRTLHLQLSPGSFVGESHGTPMINFANVRMRFLRKLTLCNYVLGRETERFILQHLGSLYSVTLEDCYRDRSWSPFFRQIVARKPSKLTNFVVSSQQTARLSLRPTLDDASDRLLPETPSSPKKCRTFPRVNAFCGYVWDSQDDALGELADGHSLAAWHCLQSVVQANKHCWERFSHSRAGHYIGRGNIIE